MVYLLVLSFTVAMAHALEEKAFPQHGITRHRGPPIDFNPGTDCSESRTKGGPSRTGDRSFYRPSPVTIAILPTSTVEPTCAAITVTHSGNISLSTIFLTTIVTSIEIITRTLPPSTDVPKTITVERTATSVSTTTYHTPTSTVVPSPGCYTSGIQPTPNPAYCNGKDCEITFEKGAVVHWELLSNRTPLVTHYIHSTCMAVICNTTEFSQYYYRSATSCVLPPCPSNSLNCECNIVVGPIRLPDGRITSVTQTGPSGWNLNLGPTATAHNIGRCGSTGAECLAAITTTLFTPLVYTGDVEKATSTAYKNDTGAVATEFLLPQLTDYFPANDPLGLCTAIALSTPATATALRQRDDVVTVGEDGVTTWPGCETLTAADAKRGLVARQSATTTQLPICPSEKASTALTVTATISDGGTTAPAGTKATSAATGTKSPLQHIWVAALSLLGVCLCQYGFA